MEYEKKSLDIQFAITILYHLLDKYDKYVNIAEINNLFENSKKIWMSLPNRTITHAVFEGRIQRILNQFVKQNILNDTARSQNYFFASENVGQLTVILLQSIKELYEHLNICYIVSGETPQSKNELIELNKIGKVHLQFNSSTNQKAIVLLNNETIDFITSILISEDILTI